MSQKNRRIFYDNLLAEIFKNNKPKQFTVIFMINIYKTKNEILKDLGETPVREEEPT